MIVSHKRESLKIKGESNLYNIHTYKFVSLSEFLNYIKTKQPLWSSRASEGSGYNWYGTESLEQARSLLEHGWEEGAQNLSAELDSVLSTEQTIHTRQRSIYDVIGGNCSVPRYLQGVPTSMVRQVKQQVKQKVTTLNSNICFSSGTSTKEIIQTCVKTLNSAIAFEAKGTRVNLNTVFAVYSTDNHEVIAFSIPVKTSTERLNILKLAFPMTHPSMLRRIACSFIERCPESKNSPEFETCYGYAIREPEVLDKIFA